MKKILVVLVTLLMLCTSAFALVKYEGMPSFPYIVFGQVAKEGIGLAGAVVEVTNQATGYSEQIRSDNNGNWQTDGMNWLTSNPGRVPVQYGDSILVKVIEGCGSGDVCSKVFSAMQSPNKDYARIDFAVTGATSCPACLPCSCGGGGSGGGYVNQVTEEKCRDEFPCDVCTTCPYHEPCVEPQSCSDCSEICTSFCDQCEEVACENCPECPENPLVAIIAGIISFLIGGGAVYVSFGTGANKVKIIEKDGKKVLYHKHPTISGYHDPNTTHREHPHKKGELIPKYEKDGSGKWQYAGG